MCLWFAGGGTKKTSVRDLGGEKSGRRERERERAREIEIFCVC